MKPLVIYHANCADGFTAAWAVRQAMDADFHPGVYGEPPPELSGRDLVLVDFCYPPAVMQALQWKARSIWCWTTTRAQRRTCPAMTAQGRTS